jgi:hypothetical protein
MVSTRFPLDQCMVSVLFASCSALSFLFSLNNPHPPQCKFRRDGWDWEKRTDGKTLREDHAKLKVDGLSVRRVMFGA